MSSFYLQAVEAKKNFADEQIREKINNIRSIKAMIKERYPQFKAEIFDIIKENLREGYVYFHIEPKHLLLDRYGCYVLFKECIQLYIEELRDDDDFEGFEFDIRENMSLCTIYINW
jgi:hypothetical protein